MSNGSLRQTPLTCPGHTRPVVDIDFSGITPYGYFLISACKDGRPMLRKGETGDWLGTFGKIWADDRSTGHNVAVFGAALNREATQAATGAADYTAKLWDAVSGDEISTFPHPHIVKAVRFGADSRRILTGCHDKLVRIYDLNQSGSDPLVFAGHTGAIRRVAWSHDSNVVVSGADDSSVRMWDIRSTAEPLRCVSLSNPAGTLEFASDGSVLVVTCGKTVSFWNTSSLEVVKQVDMPTQINAASLHPDKSIFVSGGESFDVYRYDYHSATKQDAFKGHFGPVHCLKFSPDGELYASGSEDGTLRLWQTTVGKTYGLWRCVDADATDAAAAGDAIHQNMVDAQA